MVKTSVNRMFFTGDGSVEFFVNLPVPCINAAITDHFVMLFWDMADQAFNEFHNRKRFFHIGVIFVSIIMESDKVAIVFINPGSGNHGTSEIMPNIFRHGFVIAFVWFCIDIKAFLVFPATAGFYFFKRVSDPGFHFKSLPKVWRTMIKPGVKFMYLFSLKNICETTLFTE